MEQKRMLPRKFVVVCLWIGVIGWLGNIGTTACSPPPVGQETLAEKASDGGTQAEATQENPQKEPTPEPGKEPGKEPGPEPVQEESGQDAAQDGGDESVADAEESTPEESSQEVVSEEATQEATPGETTPGEPAPSAWIVPTCTSISGMPGIGWSKDEGKTVLGSKVPIQGGMRYTYGLVALKTANTLLAQHANALYRSTDAGCTWTQLGTVNPNLLRLVLGAQDRVWAWSDNSNGLFRIDGTTITKLNSPTSNILGLGADPKDPDRIRLGAKDGTFYETSNGGTLWKKVGTAPTTTSGLSGYRVAFDPQDLDHALYGIMREGFYVTQDGGKTWKPSTGLTGNPGDPANGFNVVVSPANGQVVWAQGIDLKFAGGGKSNGKQIWHSTDGGLTFKSVVLHLQHNDVILTNGTNITPHPTKADVLYWAFGTCASQYGTNIYVYNATTNSLTWNNHPYPDFDEIVVSPADPKFLYLGIRTNPDPLCPKPKE
ncbi:MAG: hypothetical protein EP343_33675 [Deltaproteobacteria bacterium]|nr:MAG: hypothetical protein EP343_33675 [Deltaproteobacteria bacterium]